MKAKTVFACQECGAQASKWLGRCNECGAWNSLVEERAVPEAIASAMAGKRYALAATAAPQLYAEIDTVLADRLSTGIGEFDRVLGGGVVPGSLVLLGGEPGIGKSTLLLQAAAHFARTLVRQPQGRPEPRQGTSARRSISSRKPASNGFSRRSDA
jgi:DNA repair protein RadA/Sms